MPAILLLLTLLGVLYSHGHAMSREEKRKFRWVEKTKEQWRFSLLPTWRVTWLAVSFLLIKGTKWLRCSTMPIKIIWWVVFQKQAPDFKESRQLLFPLENSGWSLSVFQDHAYPADELMPLTCRGRVRGLEPSRGDVDDALGKWVLTFNSTQYRLKGPHTWLNLLSHF